MFDRRLVTVVMLLVVQACARPQSPPAEQGFSLPGRLQVEGVLGGADHARFQKAEAPRAFEFPDDHGAHPTYRSEWWYLTLALQSEQGERFGVQFTVFRQALSPAAGEGPWRSGQVYMAHVALTDVARRSHREWQRFARGRPELAGATSTPFAVWVEDWRLESATTEPSARSNGFLPLRLRASTDAIELALRLDGGKPIVLQGDAGFSRKGEGEASYYYSYPRLDVTGTLGVEGREVPVRGLGWFDREWSTSVLSSAHVGWDWFALHLDDHTDLMAFQLRRRDGQRDRFDAGTWVHANGTTEALTAVDFALTPIRTWRDERGVAWPVAWRLDGARWAQPWVVEAVLDNQRMDTAIRYWEGLVDVKDERGRALGTGYMELTGYSR